MTEAEARTVGLVGIGLMGSAIAARLHLAGFKVLGWDISPLQRAAFAQQGGEVARDALQVFIDCEVVLLSLPTHETVDELLTATLPCRRPGRIIIDTSTGDPDVATKLAGTLAEHGVEYLDATISGSSEQIRSNSAVLLIGATPAGLDRSQFILASLAERRIHVGAPGSGAQMKLVTNLVLGLNRAALAEGLAYADSLGLPPHQTLEILRQSMAYSKIMDTKGEKMIARDFSPQAKLSQHAKDVSLILQQAKGRQTELPLTQTHQALLQKAIELGFGECDNSALIESYRSQATANQECP